MSAMAVIATPDVSGFFDQDSNTVSYIIVDGETGKAAIIDSVLDFDYASGSISYHHADAMIAEIKRRNLTLEWLIETHVHADHLSAAPYIQQQLGGSIGISAEIVTVQKVFGKIFNAGTAFERDGSQFDQLFDDGDCYQIGNLTARAIHTPGHTPACMAHVIGDTVFVGDTLFMPDGGTARADFPGGDARMLYRSIVRILALPDATKMFVCHDYAPNGRAFNWQTTVGEQRAHNIHIGTNAAGSSEDGFVKLREERDASLAMPRLIMPAIQVNMRAGNLPPSESDGEIYLKVPIKHNRS
tara:strand:+ start:550 stop:1446 length:897 start_codon:yes stop_codon:yes gene_type:complete